MKIGIFGTGAYGLALCSVLCDNKHKVVMWTKFNEEKEELINKRSNEKRLKGFKIPESVTITSDIEECIKNSDLLIIAVPAAAVNSLSLELKPFIDNNHILIATKGIEQESGLFMNQIVEKHLNTKNIAVLSGPTFAVDLISKMPVGLSVASKRSETIILVRQALGNSYVKLRDTNDVIGVEICGSIKNVIALASGMLEGMNANDSTKAMLITEAMHDIKEILDSFNSKKSTVLSYAGLGDLILTCNSIKSRNYSFGKLIGTRPTKKEIKKYLENNTVEGFYTLESIYQLLKEKEVSIPIIDLIYEIVVGGKSPKLLLDFLVVKP